MNLAQLNIARLRFPLDDPRMKDFVDALPEINALGDKSPGFVWRLTDDTGDAATGLRPFEPDVIVNLTVWQTLDALRDYIYHSPHLEYMRRRREWFSHEGIPAYLALWWVPDGHIPTMAEAELRLSHLVEHGPTPHAFTLRQPFDSAEF